MKIVDDWSLFFESLETKKARALRSSMRVARKVVGYVVGEHICDMCDMSLLIPERPGEFCDFDADPNFETDGIPLCSRCLGTGKVVKNEQFKKLSEEISLIRRKSLVIQINKEKLPWKEVHSQVDSLNDRLTEIAKEGLRLVRFPVEDCLALELTKEENTTSE